MTNNKRQAGEKLTEGVMSNSASDPRFANSSVAPDALRKCLALTFPPSMVQLVQELVEPVPDFDSIAKVIGSDPVLAATILTLVNSPYYGQSAKISDLQRAAVVLGTREILKIALSISFQQNVTKSIKRSKDLLFADWRLVIWTAIASETLAKRLSPESAHLAYLISLLKDLAIFMQACLRDDDPVLDDKTCLTLLEDGQLILEQECWGHTHAEITRNILTEWQLPEDLMDGILHHHDLDTIEEHKPLTQAVILATRWGELQQGAERDAGQIIQFEMRMCALLQFDQEQLEALREECVTKFTSVLTLLNITDAPLSVRFYQHSLQTMQGFYFQSMELANITGGTDALAKGIARQLRWSWGLEHCEIALKETDSPNYQLYTQAPGESVAIKGRPAPCQGLAWAMKGEAISLCVGDKHFGEIRYYPVELPQENREALPVFADFISHALADYYRERAVLETKARTLDTLPIGVVLITRDGTIVEGNRRFFDFLRINGDTENRNAAEMLGKMLGIELLPMIDQLAASPERDIISQLFCSTIVRERTKAPCIYLSLHRQQNGESEKFLLTLEDVTEISELEVQTLKQHDFLERLVASMEDLLLTVDADGTILWTSPAWQPLLTKNLFTITRPTGAFAGTWGPEFLASGIIPAMPVEVVLMGDNGQQTDQELIFSPLKRDTPDAASTLVVGRDLTTIRRLEDKIKQQAMFDGLTGLFNHAQFRSLLEREIERSRRTERALGLIFFDLDRFKQVNDTYGHQAGDRVLKLTARALINSVRKGMDFPCRYGGDEFAAIVTEVDKATLQSLAGRIQAAVRQQTQNTVDVSIGIAMLKPQETSDQLLQRADRASYTAKKKGGGTAIWATD